MPLSTHTEQWGSEDIASLETLLPCNLKMLQIGFFCEFSTVVYIKCHKKKKQILYY